MPAPTIDASSHPIVKIEFGTSLSLADTEEHRKNFTKVFRARGPMITIALLDNMPFSTMEAGARKRLAADADALAAEGAFIAELVVVRSAIVRSLFTVYSWLRANKIHPLQCFATYEEAKAAGERMLQRFHPGAPVPNR